MKYRQNNNAFSVIDEEHLVGKTAHYRASHDTVHLRKLLGIAHNGMEHSVDAQEEVRPKSVDTILVPAECIGHLLFCFWPNDDPSTHPRLRMRPRTMPQGEPSSGFR